MAFRLILTKFRQFVNVPSVIALPQKTLFPQNMTVRSAGNLIPKTQYDTPLNKDKLTFPRVVSKYWETIPLFVTTGSAIALVFGATLWAMKNKVDVVFSTHNRRNLSRTMDLRQPTVHKFIIINQKYKPWPEMQSALDRMNEEDCRRTMQATPAAS